MINTYCEIVQDLKDYIKNYNAYMVFNINLEEIQDLKKIKWVIVGDNPGKTEKKNNEYFSTGKSAIVLRKVFEDKLRLKKNQEYICLNKTPIFSSMTRKLVHQNPTLDPLILTESTKKMAEIIFKLHNLNPDINVLIVGFAKNIKDFYPKIKDLYIGTSLIDKLYIAKHFSFGHFNKDINIDSIKNETDFITKLNKLPYKLDKLR